MRIDFIEKNIEIGTMLINKPVMSPGESFRVKTLDGHHRYIVMNTERMFDLINGTEVLRVFLMNAEEYVKSQPGL